MANNLEKAASNGLDDFVKVYVKEVFGKDQKDATPNEIAAATAAWRPYRDAAKGDGSLSYKKAISGDLNIGKIMTKAIQGQSIDKGGDPFEFTEIEDGINLVFDSANNRVKSFGEIWQGILNMGSLGLLTYFSQQAKLLNQINEKTSLTGKMSEDFRESIMDASVYANRLGISFSKVADGMEQLITESGRFKLINEDTINKLSLTSKVFFDSFSDGVSSFEEFQKVSRGARDAMDAIDKAGHSTLELGLNAKTTVKTMVKELEKLNQFGFKDGIDGLTRMVQKAQMLRMDLNNAFSIAESVMDPTKALELAANLQVIGGSIGAFNDPIRMMWMATNDIEGLQDALIGTAEGLATFNQESGSFEIVGADLRRAHAMAGALGMDLKELTNLAVQSAQRTSAAADLMSTGLILDEEDREFLTNISQMKGGRMVIETVDENGKNIEIALDSMSKDQADYLLSQKEQFKEMSTMDIARHQVTLIENLNRDVSFMAATARVEAGKTLTNVAERFGFDPTLFAEYSKGAIDKAQMSMLQLMGSENSDLSRLVSQVLDKQEVNKSTGVHNTVAGTVTHTHIHTSPVVLDDVKRNTINDPQYKSEITGNSLLMGQSYLNPFTP